MIDVSIMERNLAPSLKTSSSLFFFMQLIASRCLRLKSESPSLYFENELSKEKIETKTKRKKVSACTSPPLEMNVKEKDKDSLWLYFASDWQIQKSTVFKQDSPQDL